MYLQDNNKDIQQVINNQTEKLTTCPICMKELIDYKYNRSDNCVYITETTMENVTMCAKLCTSCKILHYPDV